MSFTILKRGCKFGRATALALLMVGTAGGLAHAADEVATERVRIGQYNLDTEDGRRAVLRQLSSAAQRVCAVGESRQLSQMARETQCYREALENAVLAVRSDRLTELYVGRGKSGAG